MKRFQDGRRLLFWCFALFPILHRAFSFSTTRQPRHMSRRQSPLTTRIGDGDDKVNHSQARRALLLTSATILGFPVDPAYAARPSMFQKKSGLFVVDTRDDISDSMRTEQVDTPVPNLSSEYALLKVLPVKNPVFRTLEQKLEALSALRFGGT